MNIYHAGGAINNVCYTNSYESILYNIQQSKNAQMIFEIDVIKIKDSFIIAHDGKESLYDYDGSFCDIMLEKYNGLKVAGKYTPMNFDLLNDIMLQFPNIIFNLDIKEKNSNYNDAITFICDKLHNNLHNIVPQIYTVDDIKICTSMGFTKFIVGIWKFYDDVYSQNSIQFIELIQLVPNIQIMGFSIDYKHNEHNEQFHKIQNIITSNIYFHGQGKISANTIKQYNENNIYFFI